MDFCPYFVDILNGKNAALLGYYAACSGNSLTTFRDNLSVPSLRVQNQRKLGLLTFEGGADRLSRNVVKELSHSFMFYIIVCFCLILEIMYFYCFVYVFLSLCMFCPVYPVFIVPTDVLRLP